MIYKAFGQIVPAEIIAGLIADGHKPERLTPERLEALLIFDYQDNLND